MKKKIISFLAAASLAVTAVPVFAEQNIFADAATATLAKTNAQNAAVPTVITVFNRAYADVYALAPRLGAAVRWTDDGGGRCIVTYGGRQIAFTSVSQYDELGSAEKFFAKDGDIFVSVRELCDFLSMPITYDNGVITVSGSGGAPLITLDARGTEGDDIVYTHYPKWAQYVVNPYKEYSYDDMINDAHSLADMYPDLIKLSSIGKSAEGRELLLMKIGRGDRKVFVCGTHHAREYIATTYLMYAMDRYAYAYRTGSLFDGYSPREIFGEITFCVVPMVNPDGVNLVQNGLSATPAADSIAQMGIYEGEKYGYAAWKANIHGVDVNWNYDKDWSAERNKHLRGSTGFNGDYPNSEPETAAVAAYVDSVPFDAYFSFHTQGQVYYWADSKSHPMYLQNVVAAATGFTGQWDSGTGIGGSFFDYVYRKYDKPTITLELCPYVGNYPYPDGDFDTVWHPARNVLLALGNEIIYLNRK